jgi:hypothetical protein
LVTLRSQSLRQLKRSDPDLFGISLVRESGVHADPENFSVGGFEVGHTSLVGLKFLRSTTCKGENIKREDNVTFSPKITKLYFLSRRIDQCEIRATSPTLNLAFEAAGAGACATAAMLNSEAKNAAKYIRFIMRSPIKEKPPTDP